MLPENDKTFLNTRANNFVKHCNVYKKTRKGNFTQD